MAQYPGLLKDLRALTANPPTDATERKALLYALREAGFAVERPVDTVHRLALAPIQTSVVKTATDLRLFNIIATQTSPISLHRLSRQTGAKPLLLRRLLRFCSLHGLLQEPFPMQYLPNDQTRTLAQPGMQAGLRYNHDVQVPAWQLLPSFLRSKSYNDISDSSNCPFQLAHNTNEPAFVWARTQPDVLIESDEWMAELRDISPSWLDTFPAEYLNQDTVSTAPFFVDVGGGIGYQCEELRSRMPELDRSIILQDLDTPIRHAPDIAGVEAQVYDFFTPQPVAGASFYYFKSCLHDWSNDKVIEILRNQVPAMGSDSVILIDEVVLPEKGGHWRAAEMDIALMACAGTFDRTEEQWASLFEQVGLKVRERYYYDDQLLHAVQILVKS